MPRGGARNDKPTALKLVTGNPGKRPLNDAEPQSALLSDLTPPTWMDAVAKRHWRAIAPKLQRMGVLTETDVDTLALYCQAYSRYRETLKMIGDLDYDSPQFEEWEPKDIAKVLSGLPVRLEKAEASMRLLSHDLGLNPAARSRLSVGKVDKPVDAMEGMLSGRRSG
jgi:P27 family predicted phage terminase small subunit